MENNTPDISIDNFKDALMCGICQEIATLPVHPTCCENSKSMAPGCLSCVRSYYELNIPQNRRSCITRKSWNGCGRDIDIRKTYSANYYIHTTQLDMVRNLLGPSNCPNEECNVYCTTTAELRRHLNGLISPNDKFPACPKAFTKCKYCGFYGKRALIEGKHFEQNHAFIQCTVCYKEIMRKDLLQHYQNHKREMFMLRTKINDLGLKSNNNK